MLGKLFKYDFKELGAFYLPVYLIYAGITAAFAILMVLGIIGEYLGKMILILNRTPQYIVRETINVTEDEKQ